MTQRHFETSSRRAFTLIELVVVMLIIGVLAGVTVVAYRSMAQDMKVESAVSTVKAGLDTARATAIRRGSPVILCFRSRDQEEERGTVIDLITTIRTGQQDLLQRHPDDPLADGGLDLWCDRYEPVVGVPVWTLPAGVKVAAPAYVFQLDDDPLSGWLTMTDFANRPYKIEDDLTQEPGNESPGIILGVLFDADGATAAVHAVSGSELAWIDFDANGSQYQGGFEYNYRSVDSPSGTGPPPQEYLDLGLDGDNPPQPILYYYAQGTSRDEPYVLTTPILAVYDDEAAREGSDIAKWIPANNTGAVDQRRLDLGTYIAATARLIEFNRYTGVVSAREE
jgi:prepilin-type N-terminal cleavage/methylation domain-containing protein